MTSWNIFNNLGNIRHHLFWSLLFWNDRFFSGHYPTVISKAASTVPFPTPLISIYTSGRLISHQLSWQKAPWINHTINQTYGPRLPQPPSTVAPAVRESPVRVHLALLTGLIPLWRIVNPDVFSSWSLLSTVREKNQKKVVSIERAFESVLFY